jgi:hypothetical protein
MEVYRSVNEDTSMDERDLSAVVSLELLRGPRAVIRGSYELDRAELALRLTPPTAAPGGQGVVQPGTSIEKGPLPAVIDP